MLMVCPNCKSTDIVAIQGQNYCINCGRQVDALAPVATTGAKTGSKDILVTPTSSKIINHNKSAASAKTAGGSLDLSGTPLKIVPAATADKYLPPKKKSSKVVGKPFSNSEPAARKNDPVIPRTTAQSTGTAGQSSHQKVKLHQVSRAGFRVRRLVEHAVASALLLVPFGMLLARLDQSITLGSLSPQDTANTLAIVSLTGLALGYIYRTYVYAATVYATAKILDARPASVEQRTSVAISCIGPLWILDLMAAAALGVTALTGAEVYNVFRGHTVTALGTTLLLIIYVLLAYATMGLIVGRMLGRINVILSGGKPFGAFVYGLRLYLANSGNLIVSFFETVLINFGLALPLFILVSLNQPGLVSLPTISYAAGVAIFITMLAAGNLIISGTFWLFHYRDAAITEPPLKRVALLGGRRPQPVGVTAKSWLTIIVISIIGLGTVLLANTH